MENILNFVNKYGNLVTLILVLVVFLNTCGVKTKVEKVEKKVLSVSGKVDSLPKPISIEDMVGLIKETPNWKTLRYEEISDKEHISINALEANEEKN